MSLLPKSVAAVAAAALIVTPVLQSCEDNSEIGESIVDDVVEVVIDSTFTVTGQSVHSDSVLSRTITQLIGTIDAPGFGLLSSNVVTQFMPTNAIDTMGVTADRIDSLKLALTFEKANFTGDSVAPMGIEVYPLTKDLTAPMWSNFNPTGYYQPTQSYGNTIYNLCNNSGTNANSEPQSYYTVLVTLPRSLGQYFFNTYKAHPEYYASPEVFADKVFKGVYLRSSYGSGRVIRVAQTLMTMYYHSEHKMASDGRDTTLYHTGYYFAVTPEVISNNNIRLTPAADIRNRIAKGEPILIGPAGNDVEIKFPGREIIESYNKNVTSLGVINSLGMSLKASAISNKYNIAPPPQLLMVLKSKRAEFFADNKIADNKTSFTALYSKSSGSYDFSDMRQYILDLKAKADKGETITDDDVTFVLVPVSINTETNTDYWSGSTTTVTSITPYVESPVMTLFDFSKTKISFVYSKQSIKK